MMQNNCATEIQLALFVEGRLAPEEAACIRQHATKCQECAHILAEAIKIQDLEAEKLLPKVSSVEAARARKSLFSLMQKKPVSNSNNQRQGKEKNQGFKSKLGHLLGAVTATVGLSGVTGALDAITPVPMLARRDEKFSDHDVRNEPSDSSKLPEDDNCNHERNTEVHEMNYPEELDKIIEAPTNIGIPEINGQSPLVQQGHEDTCAVRSQELILRDFGIDVPEDALRHEAQGHGWYQPGQGTTLENVGNLLELHGIDVNRYDNANIFTLTSELAQGHKVIVGVDSQLLWDKGILTDLEHKIGLIGTDHALLVSGIDTSDPDHVNVILTDPGTGDIARAYPMEQFIDAWKDSHCFMVATKEPAPAWLPEMVHFDYGLGHIQQIGELPYNDFVTTYGPEGNSLAGDMPDYHENITSDFVSAVFGGSHPTNSLAGLHPDFEFGAHGLDREESHGHPFSHDTHLEDHIDFGLGLEAAGHVHPAVHDIMNDSHFGGDANHALDHVNDSHHDTDEDI